MVNRKEELKKVLNFLTEKKEELLDFENEEAFIKNVSEKAKEHGLILKIKKSERKIGKSRNSFFRLHLLFDFSNDDAFCFDVFDSKEFCEYEYLSNQKYVIKKLYNEDFIIKIIKEIDLTN